MHIKALHNLGYLPVRIMAVPEGSLVDLRVPMFVIYNTNPKFYWLTNYLETVMSAVVWGGCTSATMAVQYRKILDEYADMTSSLAGFVDYQAHDFSMRGMFGLEAACISGAAHLTVFDGTDCVPAIDFIQEYYNLKGAIPTVGSSVPATEHSVMCLGGDDDEVGTIRKLVTETYPDGTVSIVCDTWDFWKVLTVYLPQLKDVIMARRGKVVIRPDSGDPVKIVCGDPDANHKWNNPARLGAVECLWRTFGGIINNKGYKELDGHIGLIYGDSITTDRCYRICNNLEQKGFASTNVVFGVGSYTYQYTTRDTYGFALKATYAEVGGKAKEIFKDPKTDDGTKKSLKGLVATYQRSDGSFYVRDQITWKHVNHCAFETVYENGFLRRFQTIDDIRENIKRGM
jgi:nicotinamide phosphoribosyltransferase